ncbi:MAG TPA: hypothetical protein VE978_09515 [Chitinophagales bacterium]|nr:hypothetical protein [Chitinophagales bacterium]
MASVADFNAGKKLNLEQEAFLNYNHMDEELIDYIFKNYQHLMTLNEAGAYRNFILDEKLQVYKNTTEKYKKHLEKARLKNAEVLRLMDNGFNNFKIKFANRILVEYAEKVFINTCSRCGKLARTPLAKQCPHCYFSWH